MINRKRPQRNVIIKTNTFATVRVKRKEQYTLCENELILPRWSGSRIDKDVKLIWFNENEEMIYSEADGMNLPKCYVDYREKSWPKVTEEDKERQRKHQEWWNEAYQKQMEQERLKESQQREQAFSIINAHHQKCKNEIKDFFMQLKEDSELWFELCHLDNQKWSQEEILKAIDDIPLFIKGVQHKGSMFGQDIIDWDTQKLIKSKLNDNRNAKQGEISELCWTFYKENRWWENCIHQTTSYYVKEFVWSQYKRQ